MAKAYTTSPFRSRQDYVREEAALEMIDKRRAELAALKKLQQNETDTRKQKMLAQKILATSNNLKSWENYLAQGAYVEDRATVIPGKKKTNG